MEKTQGDVKAIPAAESSPESSRNADASAGDPKTDYSTKAANKTSFSDYWVGLKNLWPFIYLSCV